MSITLTTPTSVSITGSNPVNETDNVGACAYMAVDYLNQTVTFEFRTGQLVSGNLKPGQYGPAFTLTVSLTTGIWSASSGQSGVVPAPALANFISQVKSDRNVIETFAAANFLPGQQVAW